MLHILLTVLAVIGKILLVLLGTILVLLLLILLVPFRYKATAKKQEKELKAEASVSWLLRFVYFKLTFLDKKLSFELRILGIPIFRLLKWVKKLLSSVKGKKGRKKKPAETAEPAAVAKPEEETQIEADSVAETVEAGQTEADAATETAEEVQVETDPVAEATEETQTETNPVAETTEETQTERDSVAETTEEGTVDGADIDDAAGTEGSENQEVPKKGIKDKIVGIFRKIGAILQKLFKLPGTVIKKIQALLEKLKGIKKKAEGLLKKAQELIELLKSDLFKAVFVRVKKELIAILRHILPRKLWGWIEFGASDPATTGEVLAVAGMLYPVMPRKLMLYPDFENTVLNLDVSLGGRIRLVVLLFHGVKILLDKNVRRLIKKIRHKGA